MPLSPTIPAPVLPLLSTMWIASTSSPALIEQAASKNKMMFFICTINLMERALVVKGKSKKKSPPKGAVDCSYITKANSALGLTFNSAKAPLEKGLLSEGLAARFKISQNFLRALREASALIFSQSLKSRVPALNKR